MAYSPDDTDIKHYDISIDLIDCLTPPYKKAFEAEMILKGTAVSETGTLELDAFSYSLSITEVTGNTSGYFHSDNLLRIKLDRTYATGEEYELRIRYKHKDVFDSAFYSFDGMVYTDCETAGARRWLPCNDVPTDKATMSITARVPAGVQFCSNGILIDSASNRDIVTYRYESKDPVPTYLIAFVASAKYLLYVDDWNYLETGKGKMEVRYYYQSGETMFNLRNIMVKTKSMLDFFSEIYCDYPFQKLAFATTDKHFPWGGMENQTIVTLCPDCWIEDLICHELVHHWFGDMISPESWADIWLNEGFATFNEALWLEEKYGNKRYMEAIQYEAVKYFNGNPGWPIYNSSWNVEQPNDVQVFESSITYSKAACVVYMLRYVMGDEKFFGALKKYTNDERFRYGDISTQEFKTFLEDDSGVELDWFFDQWIFGPNHPVYQNNFAKEKNSDSKWDVNYTVIQTQKNAGFFKMHFDLDVTFTDGTKQRISLVNDYNMQIFELEFEKEPVSFKFDPEERIILKQFR